MARPPVRDLGVWFDTAGGTVHAARVVKPERAQDSVDLGTVHATRIVAP